MANIPFKRLGVVKLPSGKYTGRDGKEHTKYAIVGELLGTPHHSRLAIKLNATLSTPEKMLFIDYDKESVPHFSDGQPNQGGGTW